MKKYRFSYCEFVKNFKSIEIYLDDDVDPISIAKTLPHIDELVIWDEDGLVTDESEIMIVEIDSDDETSGKLIEATLNIDEVLIN